MSNIRTEVKNYKTTEVDTLLENQLTEVNNMGYNVEFGNIGAHTTYALLTHKETGEEIVGYTFIREMKYYRQNVGKLKALQQAIARKKVAESRQFN